jgi:hypothetical protein
MVPVGSHVVLSLSAALLIVSSGSGLSIAAGAPTTALRYRDFIIGGSMGTVRNALGPHAREVEVRFDRPVPLHRLMWRPAFLTASGDQADDSIREIVFDFVADQLYRMTVSYDERKTDGLTHADVLTSLEDTFGPASVRKSGRGGVSAVGDATILAQWRTADGEISLRHFDYSRSYQLRLSSTALESAARVAETRAVALEARERPARAAAQRRQLAEDERIERQSVRDRNKAGFRP